MLGQSEDFQIYFYKWYRPPSLDAEKRKLAVKLYNDKNYSVNQVCQVMGISKPTLYKYVRAS